jgi:hypothetical protein
LNIVLSSSVDKTEKDNTMANRKRQYKGQQKKTIQWSTEKEYNLDICTFVLKHFNLKYIIRKRPYDGDKTCDPVSGHVSILLNTTAQIVWQLDI